MVSQQSGVYLKREVSNYSRREKSLEELSKKFLSLFLDKEETMLSLDKITNQLGVERRRIYDIINILESLQLVSRRGKNNYKWNGFQKIYQTITQYNESSSRRPEDMEIAEEDDEWCDEASCGEENQKREKSLEMLSIGFLKLFLHWKNTMTLEVAARKLSSRNIDEHKIKTKIRRLYDIANVFKSLGLIRKTALADTKKPAFEWIGLTGLDCLATKVIKGGKTTPRKESEPPNNDGIEANSQTKNNDTTETNIPSVQLLPYFQRAASTGTVDEEKRSNKKIALKQQQQPQLTKSLIFLQQKKEQKQLQEQGKGKPTYSQILEGLSPRLSHNYTNPIYSCLADTQQTTTTTPATDGILNQLHAGNQSLLNGLMAKCISKLLTNFVSKQLAVTDGNSAVVYDDLSSLQQEFLALPAIASFLTPHAASVPVASPAGETFSKSLELIAANPNVQRLFKLRENEKENEWSNAKAFEREAMATAMFQSCGKVGQQLQKQPMHSNKVIGFNEIASLQANSSCQTFSAEKKLIPPSSSTLSSSLLLKTPLLKRTLTIIPPRAERACMPTPPTKKRSFSANLQPNKLFSDSGVFSQASMIPDTQLSLLSDSTASFSSSSSLLFSDKACDSARTERPIGGGNTSTTTARDHHHHFQLSSFKKIRKLTYDTITPERNSTPSLN